MRRHNKQNRRRGAAAVEFAIVAPFLFMLFLGMVEVGRAMMCQHVLTMAAREGAREGILLGATTSTVTARVNEFTASSALNFAQSSVEVPLAPDLALPGDAISVTVSVPFSAVSSISNWFDSDFQLTGQATMRKEGFQ